MYKEFEDFWGKHNLELIIEDFKKSHTGNDRLAKDLRSLLFNSFMSGLNNVLDPRSKFNRRYDWITEQYESRQQSNESDNNETTTNG